EIPHRHLSTLTHHDLPQHARAEGLDLDVGLVGLDLGDDITALHGVALFLDPLDDLAGLHGVGQLRHDDLGDHAQTLRMAARMVAVSMGRSVRGSTISTEMPSLSSSSATSRAR